MILGIGIDSCAVERMEKSMQRQGFCDYVFAPGEQELLQTLGGKHKKETAAANFAAKESFLKAAGTGLGGFALTELALLRAENGAPYFKLGGRAAAWVAAQGLSVHVSLTHEAGVATAIVLLEANTLPQVPNAAHTVAPAPAPEGE